MFQNVLLKLTYFSSQLKLFTKFVVVRLGEFLAQPPAVLCVPARCHSVWNWPAVPAALQKNRVPDLSTTKRKNRCRMLVSVMEAIRDCVYQEQDEGRDIRFA